MARLNEPPVSADTNFEICMFVLFTFDPGILAVAYAADVC